jgi:branched-chain amino acid transport system substrate-binding protein
MSTRQKIAPIALVVVLLVSIVSVGESADKPENLNIGITVPLTGPQAFLGKQIQSGILMAIDDKNKKGGVTIAGKNYTLNPIIRDDKANAAVGKSVTEDLIFNHGVKFIMGGFLDALVTIHEVCEANKVIGFFVIPSKPGMCAPNKPYSFYCVGTVPERYLATYGYLKKYYPNARTVFGIAPATISLPVWAGPAEKFSTQFGLTWLGYEKFPVTITDFMPVISQVLKHKPDIVNTLSTGGVMGGMGALLIKQLREAGYKGIIVEPACSDPKMLMAGIGREMIEGLIDIGIDPESPVVDPAYRDFHQRFVAKFKMEPVDIPAEMYNPAKAFFEFLDGKDTLDTTVLMEQFAKYRWTGIWGESRWVGEPIYGTNRVALRVYYVSEWHNGKRETRWKAPIPWELLTGKK